MRHQARTTIFILTVSLILTLFMSYVRNLYSVHVEANYMKESLYHHDQVFAQVHIRDNKSQLFVHDADKKNKLFEEKGKRGNSGGNTTAAQHKVILVAYMRSGSSLTGDLLQQHPGVFYVYEPLWMTERVFHGRVNTSRYRILDNTPLSVPKSLDELKDRYVQVLDSFLNCRLRDIDVLTLTQPFMQISKSTREFKKCAVDDTDLARVERCMKLMQARCLQSRIVVVKVIRVTIQQASSLMAFDPKLKIIHLIRDPRGTLPSQAAVGMFQLGNIETTATGLCQRIESDIESSKKISRMYPNRILTVRYEDIAEHPLESIRQLYAFLNVTSTPEINNYVWNITYGGQPDGCVICTVRSNATKTANFWRNKLQYSVIRAIQRQCGGVLGIFGYRIFEFSSAVQDINISAHYSSYDPELFKVNIDNDNVEF